MIASRPFVPSARETSSWPARPFAATSARRARSRPCRRARRRSTSTSSPIRTPSATTSIQFVVPEFTCNCPLTGQPDFAHFTIEMVCDKLCIELKSLKLYFWSFRDVGAFHESGDQRRSSTTSSPRRSRASSASAARWNVRGGIYTNVVAEHRKKGWSAGARGRAAGRGRIRPRPRDRGQKCRARPTPRRLSRPTRSLQCDRSQHAGRSGRARRRLRPQPPPP